MTRWISEEKVRRMIKFYGSCCLSCHEDDDEGYSDLIEIDFPRERVARVCCAVSVAYDKWKLKQRLDEVKPQPKG